MGEGGRWWQQAEDEVTHTRFSSHSSRNCWNFWDISSWALPTALRIFPKTAGGHTRPHTRTRTRSSQCNYSQSRRRRRILQACCSAGRHAAFVMQQGGEGLVWWRVVLLLGVSIFKSTPEGVETISGSGIIAGISECPGILPANRLISQLILR